MTTVAICDYGAGNVRSVEIAFRRLGAEIVDDPAGADLTVLPGVGSAASAMDGLRERGLDNVLRDRVQNDRPVLGICLGLQLALEESEEDGGVPGLGELAQVAGDVPVVPGALHVSAMIDGDTVQPGAPGGFTAERVSFAEGLEEHIVGRVLSLLRIAQHAQREIINRAAVLGVKAGEFRRRPFGLRRFRTLLLCQRLVHERLHWD